MSTWPTVRRLAQSTYQRVRLLHNSLRAVNQVAIIHLLITEPQPGTKRKAQGLFLVIPGPFVNSDFDGRML